MFQLKNITFMFFVASFICSADELVEDAIKNDNDLNDAYKNAIEQLNDIQKVKLKKAQLLWIKYRNAICDFEADLPKKGHWIEDKVSNSRSLECISRLSKVRTQELNYYSRLIAETKRTQQIEYTDVVLLNEQLEKKNKQSKYGNAVIKGSFTVLIKKAEHHIGGSVTLHTQINPTDERNLNISLLANVAKEFKDTYGSSPDNYLIGKTVILKGSARRGAIIRQSQIPYVAHQNNFPATILPIASLSNLTIIE